MAAQTAPRGMQGDLMGSLRPHQRQPTTANWWLQQRASPNALLEDVPVTGPLCLSSGRVGPARGRSVLLESVAETRPG
ncbi:hypothetical protein J1614_011512 [Plenodomus biglobosus]|nr:hypothetical protein J1614_011512 [Plenodomus biglobosus]